MNNHQAAAPKRSGRHLRRRSWIRARLAGFGAALLLAGSVAGFGAAKLQQTHAMNNPLASCGGTVRILNTYLEAIDGHLADVAVEDFGADASHLQGWAAINEVFDQTRCSPQRVVDSLPWTQLSPATAEMLAHKVVGWSQNADIPNLPARATEILADWEGDDLEDEPVWGEAGEGRMLLVFAEEECDCFDTLGDLAQESGYRVVGVRLNLVSELMAEENDWEMVLLEELSIELPGELPAVLLLEDGHMSSWVVGAEDLANPWLTGEALFNPLNITAERVPAEGLYFYGTCDGFQAEGVVQNATDRPIHAVVVTNPAVAFDDEFLVLSRRVVHDLGVLEAFDYTTFDVSTGQPYHAPCQLEARAVYADGETLGAAYSIPDEVPAEHRIRLREVLDLEGMPTEVEPEGFYPRPSDVREIEEAAEDAPSDEETPSDEEASAGDEASAPEGRRGPPARRLRSRGWP